MDFSSVSSDAVSPRRKKIVICCDGTGNEFGAPDPKPKEKNSGQNSNVVKLYTALQIDNHQVAYYHPGVGTMGAPNAGHWWSREWSQIKGLAFGAGFRDTVLDAYRYLMEVYNDNGGNGNEDEVYLFGFSRGAYTARALAGFLHGYGLLCRGNEGHLPYAWRMYIAQHDNRKKNGVEPDDSFKATFSHRHFKIHFVGVWDTVSSVGWIYTPLRLFNLSQNDTILRGRHAISIDEHRCFFENNLWGDPLPEQDMVQAWFAGVHSDIGGSYLQPESVLSNITLKWMLKEVGLFRGEDGNYPDKPGILIDNNRYELIFGKMPEHPVDPELLYILPSISKLHKSLNWRWWIPEIVPHIYFDNDEGKEMRRVPLGLRKRQLPGGSLVHASVMTRMETAELKYKPKNVTREELVLTGDPVPLAADGTRYYRFEPKGRKKNSTLFTLFDRFIVTFLFGIFNVVIFLPVMLGVVLAAVATVLAVIAGLSVLIWHLLVDWVPRLAYLLLSWLELLGGLLMRYVHWLEHFL